MLEQVLSLPVALERVFYGRSCVSWALAISWLWGILCTLGIAVGASHLQADVVSCNAAITACERALE